MPTYDYACTHCDHAFEVFQAFTDDALTVCPECGGRLRKVFGSVGVVFKGSGFYRTDSRSGSAAVPATKSESSSDSKGSSDASAAKSTGDKTPPASSTSSEKKASSSPKGSGTSAA